MDGDMYARARRSTVRFGMHHLFVVAIGVAAWWLGVSESASHDADAQGVIWYVPLFGIATLFVVGGTYRVLGVLHDFLSWRRASERERIERHALKSTGVALAVEGYGSELWRFVPVTVKAPSDARVRVVVDGTIQCDRAIKGRWHTQRPWYFAHVGHEGEWRADVGIYSKKAGEMYLDFYLARKRV